ncbi:MAG: hypothetical protein V1775_00410 [Bacteroidota bacterium]
MEELKKMSNSFEETLKDSNLQNMAIDMTEAITDSFLEDGILKDIPLVNTILGMGKITSKISNILFLKKVLSFLSELENISPEDRKKMIEKIDSSKKYRVKVGEKLLYIIDKCDDYENAQYISRLFVGYVNGEMSYPDFLRASKLIERIYIGDLIEFIKDERTVLKPDELTDYEGTGLYQILNDDISIRDQDDWKASGKYVVDGGEPRGYLTEIGAKIREVLKTK